jgi:hypothetical protein
LPASLAPDEHVGEPRGRDCGAAGRLTEIEPGAIQSFEEESYWILGSQHGKSIAENFSYTRRQEGYRQNYARENGKYSEQLAVSHLAVQFIEGRRHELLGLIVVNRSRRRLGKVFLIKG